MLKAIIQNQNSIYFTYIVDIKKFDWEVIDLRYRPTFFKSYEEAKKDTDEFIDKVNLHKPKL